MLDPEDATLFSNRSLCWLHMGKPLLSLMDALECRKKRPDWPKACYRQGMAQMSLKVGQKTLLTCPPDLPYKLFLIIHHVLYYQDYKGACQSLLDALKLDPGSSELQDALRYDISSFNSSLLIAFSITFDYTMKASILRVMEFITRKNTEYMD